MWFRKEHVRPIALFRNTEKSPYLIGHHRQLLERAGGQLDRDQLLLDGLVLDRRLQRLEEEHRLLLDLLGRRKRDAHLLAAAGKVEGLHIRKKAKGGVRFLSRAAPRRTNANTREKQTRRPTHLVARLVQKLLNKRNAILVLEERDLQLVEIARLGQRRRHALEHPLKAGVHLRVLRVGHGFAVSAVGFLNLIDSLVLQTRG